MRYHVNLFFNDQQYLHSAAKIYTGLCLLAQQGVISLRLTPHHAPYMAHNVTVILEAESGTDHQTRCIAFDLRDRSDQWTTEAIAYSDIYFKRSYYTPDVAAVPVEQQAKILPLGLNYACTSVASKRLVLRCFAAYYARRALRSPRRFLQQLRGYLDWWREYIPLADYTLFEQAPTIEVEPLILYQSRIWAPADAGEDGAALNQQRVALVRTLKAAFGDRFLGGVEPTPYAQEHFPDAITPHPVRHRDYIAMAKRARIGIYSRGLSHSLAFKLPEYLASSKCIVGEPLRNQLPTPLLPEEHYLEFSSPAECVAQCQRLLDDTELAAAMRERNFAYYQAEVSPAAHLLRCLERAFEIAPIASA